MIPGGAPMRRGQEKVGLAGRERAANLPVHRIRRRTLQNVGVRVQATGATWSAPFAPPSRTCSSRKKEHQATRPRPMEAKPTGKVAQAPPPPPAKPAAPPPEYVMSEGAQVQQPVFCSPGTPIPVSNLPPAL